MIYILRSPEFPAVTDHLVGIWAEYTHRNIPVILTKYLHRTDIRWLHEADYLIEHILTYPLTMFEQSTCAHDSVPLAGKTAWPVTDLEIYRLEQCPFQRSLGSSYNVRIFRRFAPTPRSSQQATGCLARCA